MSFIIWLVIGGLVGWLASVVMKTDENGNKLEPVEEVIIDVDEGFSGVVVQKVSERKGALQDMRPSGHGRQRLDSADTVDFVGPRGGDGVQSWRVDTPARPGRRAGGRRIAPATDRGPGPGHSCRR